MFHVRISVHRGRDPAEEFLDELKEIPRVADAVLFVDGVSYFTALARIDLSGELNYTDRNIVEDFFQTYTMRIEHFRETWNRSQASAEHWPDCLHRLLQSPSQPPSTQ